MVMWYKLIDKKPVVCSLQESPIDDIGARRVAETFIGDIKISTVFLSLDHGYGIGDPILFETMIFGGPEEIDEFQERYCTWEEAEEGHKNAVELVKSKMKN